MLVLAAVISPFLLHLTTGYRSLCQDGTSSSFCASALPNVYSYVQQKYWNVGFLKYYSIGNLVFILIGTPAIGFGLTFLGCYSRVWNLPGKGLYLSYCLLLAVTVTMTNLQSSTRFLSSHPIFYVGLGSGQFRLGRIWCLAYCGLGLLLFPLGFPWT